MGMLRHEGADAADVIKWVLAGFKAQFLENARGDTAHMKEEYTAGLDKYLDILKNGL